MSADGEPEARGDSAVPEFEVIIVNARREAWRRRLGAARRGGAAVGRVAGYGGRVSLARVRRYLATPEGRRVAVSTAVAAATVAAGVVLLRRWLGPAQAAAAAVAAVYRRVRSAAGTIGRAVNSGRFLLPLRGIWRFLRGAGLAATFQLYRPCPDCRARVHHDAHVCWRCGCRHLDRPLRRRLWAPRLLLRVLTLRLYRPCPDCHRRLHADARVCWRCGWRAG